MKVQASCPGLEKFHTMRASGGGILLLVVVVLATVVGSLVDYCYIWKTDESSRVVHFDKATFGASA